MSDAPSAAPSSAPAPEPAADPAAANVGDRRVEGGAIIYKAEASDPAEPVANFRAESLAIKAMVMECGMADKEIKVHSRKSTKVVEETPGYNKENPSWNRVPPQTITFTSRVEVSIPISECERDKVISSNPVERKKHENDRIVRDQHRFERLTDADLGLAEEEEDHGAPASAVLPMIKEYLQPTDPCMAKYRSLVQQSQAALGEYGKPTSRSNELFAKAQSKLAECQH